MRDTSIFAVILLLAYVSGCASAPISHTQPGVRPDDTTDEAGLWQMVERDEYQLQTSSEVIRDEQLQTYLEHVLCRVVLKYCDDIRIYVLPGSMLNAYMQPNGTMVVFTGLLLRLKNEAELAAIFGHEVAHYTKRHSLQQYRAWRTKTGAMQSVASLVYAGAGIASTNANAAANTGQYGRAIEHAERSRQILNVGSAVLSSLAYYAISSQMAFSRDQEREADALGASWSYNAGYDPNAFAAIMEVMEKEEALIDTDVPTFLRGHPVPGERKKSLSAQAGVLHSHRVESTNDEQSKDSYFEMIAPFRNSWLHEARRGLNADLESALLQRQREIGVPPGLVSFHEADMYREHHPDAQPETLLGLFSDAVLEEGYPPEGFREYGFVLMDAARAAEAVEALETYLREVPNAIDRAVISSYIDELR